MYYYIKVTAIHMQELIKIVNVLRSQSMSDSNDKMIIGNFALNIKYM